ncbi:MAG: hypothetical protein F6J93_14480 [Oscillatoria sp. SIO1A7]|nr:hypothetical protein [Oscillatoria sp. SIO1A7]
MACGVWLVGCGVWEKTLAIPKSVGSRKPRQNDQKAERVNTLVAEPGMHQNIDNIAVSNKLSAVSLCASQAAPPYE